MASSWPTTSQEHEFMANAQRMNRSNCTRNAAELWMKARLKSTPYKWTQQACWGYRLFDFWCSRLGIAVEVDGLDHDAEKDFRNDFRNYKVSGIIVLRVPNFDEKAADFALARIAISPSWNERREMLGLKRINGGADSSMDPVL